jgi:enamine deaminase RidA (YjgF/YER057c/UK114 family)
MKFLQPQNWMRPRGYSNGVSTAGQQIFISGMIGWDEQGQFHTDDFVGQVRQTLQNIVTVLQEADAKPEHIVRMTWYVTNRAEYLASSSKIGEAYRAIIGGHFPSMTAVQVVALMEDRAKVEIEVTAVVPEIKEYE